MGNLENAQLESALRLEEKPVAPVVPVHTVGFGGVPLQPSSSTSIPKPVSPEAPVTKTVSPEVPKPVAAEPIDHGMRLRARCAALEASLADVPVMASPPSPLSVPVLAAAAAQPPVPRTAASAPEYPSSQELALLGPRWCPGEHRLRRLFVKGEVARLGQGTITCDSCGKLIPDSSFFNCSVCEYDVCLKCIKVPVTERSRVIYPVRTEGGIVDRSTFESISQDAL